MSFSSIADAQNAVKRLHDVFEAETLIETKSIDEDMKDAVIIEHGEFTWDSPPPQALSTKKKGLLGGTKTPKRQSTSTPNAGSEMKVFSMKDVNLTIPEGQLTAIVGT